MASNVPGGKTRRGSKPRNPDVEAIDYAGRYAFLHATTSVMSPAPIDTLFDLALPAFSRWAAHLDRLDSNPVFGQIVKAAAFANRKLPTVDSKGAAALKRALAGWMKESRFRDPWIHEAALSTLFVAACGHAKQRSWYLQPPWVDIYPEAKDVPVPRKLDESDDDYLKRYNRHFRLLARRRKGMNANQEQPALWTARRFMGASYVEIAANLMDPDAVRKAVDALTHRIGPTLPETL